MKARLTSYSRRTFASGLRPLARPLNGGVRRLEMHPELSSLVAMLTEASSLFSKHEMVHWASWLEQDAQRIERSDFYGIEHLLSAYGGMGSINDVGLGEPDPKNPSLLRTHPDDARLQVLIRNIHSLATKLSNEHLGRS